MDTSPRSSDKKRGFSLIELLISTAIIALISAIVIVRFTSFDSTVLLKSLAYEVAATVRDAQVYAVSVVQNNPTTYKNTFGVSFTPGSNQYVFFTYAGSGIPKYTATTQALNTYKMGGTMEIQDICVFSSSSGPSGDCSPARLDISFRRPEFRALFFAEGYSQPSEDISSVQIKLGSPTGGDVWLIQVSLLGQITVKKQ